MDLHYALIANMHVYIMPKAPILFIWAGTFVRVWDFMSTVCFYFFKQCFEMACFPLNMHYSLFSLHRNAAMSDMWINEHITANMENSSGNTGQGELFYLSMRSLSNFYTLADRTMSKSISHIPACPAGWEG